ncbi:MAG: hypothetical protein IJU52_07965 [Clostridia bacterium]|nr:hypothetical protein [Clostridia bacterium]
MIVTPNTKGVRQSAFCVGGDCDTLTCIAGGIAEAFYGVPKEIAEKAYAFLDERMKKVIGDFRAFVGCKS